MAGRVMRMEAGSFWSHTFLIKGGDPPVPLTIADWTLEGKASIKQLRSTTVPLYPGEGLEVFAHDVTESDLASDDSLEVGQEIQLLEVSLTDQQTDDLGEGMVLIEVRRTDPRPLRPILRFEIRNNRGY